MKKFCGINKSIYICAMKLKGIPFQEKFTGPVELHRPLILFVMLTWCDTVEKLNQFNHYLNSPWAM